jgi:hypothetical protein
MIYTIKNSWSWVGIEPKEIKLENDFGNLIIEDTKNRYWRLCPEELYCEIVAENKSELEILINSNQFKEDWAMDFLIKELKKKYSSLESEKKFHMVISPILGGEYKLNNIKIINFKELIEFSGYLAQQINDLPEGSKIELTPIV